MKKNKTLFVGLYVVVLASLNANAVSLDISDLPDIVQKNAACPDFGLSAEVRDFFIKKNIPTEKWIKAASPTGSEGYISKDARSGWDLSKDKCQLVLTQKNAVGSVLDNKPQTKEGKSSHGYSFNFEKLPNNLLELELLARKGNADAQFRLGMSCSLGSGVRKDKREAVKWLTLSAQQGLVEAQFMLGSMIHKGIGTPKDPKAAFNWFKESSSEGHAPAQLALGFMYANGQGAWRDMKAAEKWYKRAAEQGLVGAQHNLGLLYSEGKGVNHDHFAACAWLTIASKNKLKLSSKELEKIYGSGRFSIADLTQINERVKKMIKENPKLIKNP